MIDDDLYLADRTQMAKIMAREWDRLGLTTKADVLDWLAETADEVEAHGTPKDKRVWAELRRMIMDRLDDPDSLEPVNRLWERP